jgi:hypothetical protein
MVNRDAAGVQVGDLVEVSLALDREPRMIEVPPDAQRRSGTFSGQVCAGSESSSAHNGPLDELGPTEMPGALIPARISVSVVASSMNGAFRAERRIVHPARAINPISIHRHMPGL